MAENEKPCPAVGGGRPFKPHKTTSTIYMQINAQDEELRCATRVAVEAASSSWAVPVKWITPSDALIFRELWLASSREPCKFPERPLQTLIGLETLVVAGVNADGRIPFRV